MTPEIFNVEHATMALSTTIALSIFDDGSTSSHRFDNCIEWEKHRRKLRHSKKFQFQWNFDQFFFVRRIDFRSSPRTLLLLVIALLASDENESYLLKRFQLRHLILCCHDDDNGNDNVHVHSFRANVFICNIFAQTQFRKVDRNCVNGCGCSRQFGRTMLTVRN